MAQNTKQPLLGTNVPEEDINQGKDASVKRWKPVAVGALVIALVVTGASWHASASTGQEVDATNMADNAKPRGKRGKGGKGGKGRTQTLRVGEVCYSRCEDGSKPFVNKRSSCAVGLTCQSTIGMGDIFMPGPMVGGGGCGSPETCQAPPRPPCQDKECGQMCVVGGDMAGLCDVKGVCSFDYVEVERACKQKTPPVPLKSPCKGKQCAEMCSVGDMAGMCDTQGKCSFNYDAVTLSCGKLKPLLTLQSKGELREGEVCYRFCEDESQPAVNKRANCAPGLKCRTTAPGDMMFAGGGGCNFPDTCQAPPKPPCQDKMCGESCVFQGDMVGVCDAYGTCSTNYASAEASCKKNCFTKEVWNDEKKKVCCAEQNIGCEYNCVTREVWPQKKKEWCCKNKKLGCEAEKDTYDCLTKEVWTPQKAEWCCNNKKLGCDNAKELEAGEMCYQFCEDGSKPLVNKRTMCGDGLTCQSPQGDIFIRGGCTPPWKCQPPPRPPCDGKKCGQTCIVGGDMAGVCDSRGKCSFSYGEVEAECAEPALAEPNHLRPQIAGGWQAAGDTKEDDTVIRLAVFALEKLKQTVPKLKGASFNKVLNSKSQVVAGMNYKIEMSVTLKDGHESTLTVSAFEQSWSNVLQLTAASMSAPVGGASMAIVTEDVLKKPLDLGYNAFQAYHLGESK